MRTRVFLCCCCWYRLASAIKREHPVLRDMDTLDVRVEEKVATHLVMYGVILNLVVVVVEPQEVHILGGNGLV